MVKLLTRFLFVFFFFAIYLTGTPAWAQANNRTPLYFGCVAWGYDPNVGDTVCVKWAPTTGANPPDQYATFLGYINIVQESGTVELYWFCGEYNTDGDCVKWRAWPPGPHYGNDATLIGYIKTDPGADTVWIWENCVAQTNDPYCTRWGLATSQAPAGMDGSLQIGYIYTSATPPPLVDDCSRAGLTMCVRFEALPDTRFDGTTVTSLNMTGTSVESSLVWNVENKGSDSATDTNRIALSPGIGRDGSSGIRLQTLDNDSDVHGSTTTTATLERSEIALFADDTGANAITSPDNWWAHSLFVPVESTLPNSSGSQVGVFQFHGTPGAGDQPNFILQIRNQEAPQARLVFRAYTAGFGGDPSDGTQYTYNIMGGPTVKGQCIYDFEKGHWYDFVHHIRWSYTGAGSHEIWMRKDNGPVTKVLNKTNINTLYMNDRAYLKLGVYHDAVLGANTSVIHDRIRRGSSADAVRMPDFTVDLNASVSLCTGTY